MRFKSALYLGLTHPSRALPTWTSLTRGAPAAIDESTLARDVAAGAARLLGVDAAVVATSTLHLAIDLCPLLAPRGSTIYAESSLYPILAWGIERAAARGGRVRSFPSHDTRALRSLMARDAPFARPPLVIADGFCPSCGRAAPLAEYAELTRVWRGLLVVDDTQALGVLGRGPSPVQPYGMGGGGTLAFAGAGGPDVVIVGSMAKAFGAPVAVLGAAPSVVARFRENAATRTHCSPPSTAALLAAQRALRLNHEVGDALRARLLERVDVFRHGVASTGLLASQTKFPVQSLVLPRISDGVSIVRELQRRGVHALLTRRHGGGVALTFMISAAHTPGAIETAAKVTASVLRRLRRAPVRPRPTAFASHAG